MHWMKKPANILAVFLLVLAGIACNRSGETAVKADAEISFDTTKHDFGAIAFNSEAEFEFIFENTGSVPLLLTHVKSTCGCTIPEWSNEPVKSGKRGTILVTYDTHRVGAFNKSIYVYSNAGNGVQRLSITGKVNRASPE